jgi:hypothetical protein
VERGCGTLVPYHDLYCPACGEIHTNVFLPLVTLPEPVYEHGFLTTTRVDFPSHCGRRMSYIPPRVAMDTFTPFSTEIRQPDGSYKSVAVDSLATMRRIERESEQRAKNGEGEAIRFRMWSNDRSNGDVNTFGPDPTPILSPEVKTRFGLRGGALKSVDAPEVTLGDGVTEANVSALVGE